MKYIICPMLKIILLLLIIVFYGCNQILHILWHLKADKHLLKSMVGERFYYKSQRPNFHTKLFNHQVIYKIPIAPKSLLQLILWELTHYDDFEIVEITKKEEALYKEFCKNNKP